MKKLGILKSVGLFYFLGGFIAANAADIKITNGTSNSAKIEAWTGAPDNTGKYKVTDDRKVTITTNSFAYFQAGYTLEISLDGKTWGGSTPQNDCALKFLGDGKLYCVWKDSLNNDVGPGFHCLAPVDFCSSLSN